MNSFFPSSVSKLILGLVVVIVASLQYQFWCGEGGYLAHQALLHQIHDQQKNNQELQERNRVLAAEVYDLKNANEAIEEHARLDLGLIKPHETFVQMSTISTQYQPIFATSANLNPADTAASAAMDAHATVAEPPFENDRFEHGRPASAP